MADETVCARRRLENGAIIVTLNLAPETEALLREKATRQGSDISTIVTQMVLEALEREAKDTYEAVVGIQRGRDDFEQGRSRASSDFAAEQQRLHRLTT